jgi:simple sugar transport system ATP-binding protein
LHRGAGRGSTEAALSALQAIELSHVSKRFGEVIALDDVSLELRPGERLALVGENGAGKSSLMNVLYGLYQPDAGELKLGGAVTRVRTPADAIARGIGMVHQHFTLVPTLSVAENVVLGAEPTRRGLYDGARAEREVAQTCARLNFSVDPRALVGTLSVGSQQKVEIVKALHRGVKTLILDEPTAVLTPQEADELFAVTRSLSAQGLTVVLISHKLKEVLAFASRIVVMRRGKKVAEVSPAQTDASALAALMVGDAAASVATVHLGLPGLTGITAITAITGITEAGAGHPDPEQGRTVEGSADLRPLVPKTEPRLELSHLEAQGLHDVSFELHAGEILGLAGVDGNGQRELAEVLTGLREWTGGVFTLLGHTLDALSPARAHALGVAHVPEDRLRRALVSELSIEENVSLGRQGVAPFARGAFIDFAGRRARTVELLEKNDVRPRDPQLRAGGLSGGNQQKLVVGRELDAAPKVLVVVQPTRGLDIAAVNAVRTKLLAQRAAGCAVLLSSLDLDEVLALSDRVLVMYQGRITARLERAQFDERVIGRFMLGVH